MNKEIVIAGTIVLDKIKMITNYPSVGMLANITSDSLGVGGCVANTSIALKRIDSNLNIGALAIVGDDSDGLYLKAVLKKNGVDISQIKTNKFLPTSYTDVFTIKDTGERTFFHQRGANSKFTVDDVDLENIDCSIFHIGYLLLLDTLDDVDKQYGTKMAKLLSKIQDKGIKTSIDIVSETEDRFKKIVLPSLKYCNYVIINEIEASKIVGISPPYDDYGNIVFDKMKNILSCIIDYGVKDKVIVHCPSCSFCMTNEKKLTYEPSFKLPQGFIKGCVGAGDAFCAGILFGLLKNYSDKDMLEFASASAVANLSEKDSISGMRCKNEIENLVKNFEKQKLSF